MAGNNNVHRGQQRDKPFRDALRIVTKERDTLRKAAEALAKHAEEGNIIAIDKLADRLDGKVAQAIVGDDEHPAVNVNITDEDRIAAIKRLAKSVAGKVK